MGGGTSATEVTCVHNYQQNSIATQTALCALIPHAYGAYLQEGPNRRRAGHAQCGAHKVAGVLALHALNLQRSVRADMQVTVCIVWEHQLLRALLRPEDRRRRIAGGHTVERGDAVQADFAVERLGGELGWCCVRVNDKILPKQFNYWRT